MKKSLLHSPFFLLILFTSYLHLYGQGKGKLKSTILSSGFFIEDFYLDYKPNNTGADYYIIQLEKFKDVREILESLERLDDVHNVYTNANLGNI